MTATSSPALPKIDDAAGMDSIVDGYFAGGLDALPDAQLSELVAASVSRPKVARASSFVLHAPLELLSRTALLPMVEPQARTQARQRLVWLGAAYKAAGEEVEAPAKRLYDQPQDALAELGAALSTGDAEAADSAAAWLAYALTPAELSCRLADAVIPRLSAAAHGSIFLFHLPRVAPRSAAVALTLRGLVRELAAEPDWNLSWYRQRDTVSCAPAELLEQLLKPRSPGDPGSPFIYPTMSLVERSGLAKEVLDAATRSLSVRQATQTLLRVAAWSMLQDDIERAPYGWSHCLSMPQAVLGIAHACTEPSDAVAVAATYVLGFRATLGRVAIDPQWKPELLKAAASDPLEALAAEPQVAAAAVWHAAAPLIPALVARLATAAAVHPDAHLAKYTHACFDAANADPAAARLYLAAAAYLGAWWAQRPGAGNPFLH